MPRDIWDDALAVLENKWKSESRVPVLVPNKAKTHDELLQQQMMRQRNADPWEYVLPLSSQDRYRNTEKGWRETEGLTGYNKANTNIINSIGSKAGRDAVRNLFDAPESIARGLAGGTDNIQGALHGLVGDVTGSGYFKKAGTNFAGRATDTMGAGGENYETDTGRYANQGVVSLGNTLPGLIGTAVTKNPNFLLANAGASGGTQGYNDARAAGLGTFDALNYGAGQGAVEVVTEVLPARGLAAFSKRGVKIKPLTNYIVSDVLGEQVATLGQDAMETDALKNSQNKWQEYRDDIGGQAYATLISGLAQGAGQVGIASGAHYAGNLKDRITKKEKPVKVQSKVSEKLWDDFLNKYELKQAQGDYGNLQATLSNATQPMRTRSDIPSVQQVTNFQPKTEIQKKVVYHAQQQGFDPAIGLAIVGIESSFNPNAKSPHSSAGGLLQYIDGTAKALGVQNKFNPDEALGKGFAELSRKKQRLQVVLGREPMPHEIYLSWQQGDVGAKHILTANDEMPLVDVVRGFNPKHAQAIVNNNGMQGMTVGQAKSKWANKMGEQMSKYGGQAYAVNAPNVMGMLAQNEGIQTDPNQQLVALDQMDAADAQKRAAEEIRDTASRLRGKISEVEHGGAYQSAAWEVMEADSLKSGAVQPQYQAMANNLDYRKLGDSPISDYGAPTLASDDSIVDGRGRTQAITQAYLDGKAESYKEGLINDAGQYGLKASDIAKMKEPLLVRKFTDSPKPNTDNIEMARSKPNKADGLDLVHTESEKQPDSGRLTLGENESQINHAAMQTLIEKAVGRRARFIDLVDAGAQQAKGAQKLISKDVEGWYSPATKRISMVKNNLTPERAAWVAFHELAHRGIDTHQAKEFKSLLTQASKNQMVRQLAQAIRKERVEHKANQLLAVEEAIAELYAASQTNDYKRIKERYGIAVPKSMQSNMSGYLSRFVERLKTIVAKLLGKNTAEISNEFVFDLLERIDRQTKESIQEETVSEKPVNDLDIYQEEDKNSKRQIKHVDSLDALIEAGKGTAQERVQYVLNEVRGKQAEMINEHLGVDVQGFKHVVDNYAIKHILKHHGNKESEAARGQLNLQDKDFMSLPDILNHPDKMAFGAENSRAEPLIVYLKKLDDGSLMVVEEIRKGRESLAVVSMRKYPPARSAASLLSPSSINVQNDRAVSIVSLDNTDSDVNKYSKQPETKSVAIERKRFLDFNAENEWVLGRKAYDKLVETIQPVFGKVGLAHNAPESFRRLMRDYRAQLNVASEHTKNIADAGKVMSEAERKLLSDVLEKEVAAGITPPQELEALAVQMRQMLNQQGDDLVALDMLSKESSERWRETYLPRMYQKHIGLFDKSELGQMGKAFRQAVNSKHVDIKGSQLKGRGIFKTVPLEAVGQYEALGYELRDQTKKNGKELAVMWKDFSKEQREQMGEVRDAMMRFTVGYLNTQKDIARGMLFKRIANNEELAGNTQVASNWVQIPKTEITGTGGVKRYGALAGMFVHPEVADSLKQQFFIDNQVQKVWRKTLGWWKMTKTAYNAVAHVNNVISNVGMVFVAGVNPLGLVDATKDMISKNQWYQEALEQGLIGDAVDVAGLKELFVGLDQTSAEPFLDGFITRSLKKADRLAMNMPSKLKKFAEKAYTVEDEVFKVLLYKEGRKRGLDKRTAADYALSYMFDYSDLPKTARWVRDTGTIPFVSYSYKAIQAVGRAAITRPHRVLALTGLLYGINALSYTLLGGEADEEKERKVMPKWQKGITAFGTPKLIRMPFNDANNDPVFIDIYRWLPLGDFADTDNQMGGLPVPQFMMPNGPLINHAFALGGNKDTFTGREIVNDAMQADEKALIYGKWLASQWMPASVGMPYSYHTNNVLDGIKNQFEDTPLSRALEMMGYSGTNYRGDPVDLTKATLGSVGVKMRGFSVEEEEGKARRSRGYQVRELQSDVRQTMRNNKLTDAAKQAQVERRKKQVARLMGVE